MKHSIIRKTEEYNDFGGCGAEKGRADSCSRHGAGRIPCRGLRDDGNARRDGLKLHRMPTEPDRNERGDLQRLRVSSRVGIES